MTRTETVLSEIIPILEQADGGIKYPIPGGDFRRRIPELIDGFDPPAYIVEQQAEGTDRAQRAIDSIMAQLKEQLPLSKMVHVAVLLIKFSSEHYLLLREGTIITEKFADYAGPEAWRFQTISDDTSPMGKEIALSLVYWVKDRE